MKIDETKYILLPCSFDLGSWSKEYKSSNLKIHGQKLNLRGGEVHGKLTTGKTTHKYYQVKTTMSKLECKPKLPFSRREIRLRNQLTLRLFINQLISEGDFEYPDSADCIKDDQKIRIK